MIILLAFVVGFSAGLAVAAVCVGLGYLRAMADGGQDACYLAGWRSAKALSGAHEGNGARPAATSLRGRNPRSGGGSR